jgi:hypothetical protein
MANIFMMNKEIARGMVCFFHQKKALLLNLLILTKNLLSYILDDFISNSSGHPETYLRLQKSVRKDSCGTPDSILEPAVQHNGDKRCVLCHNTYIYTSIHTYIIMQTWPLFSARNCLLRTEFRSRFLQHVCVHPQSLTLAPVGDRSSLPRSPRGADVLELNEVVKLGRHYYRKASPQGTKHRGP